jgi:hypothetical protein
MGTGSLSWVKGQVGGVKHPRPPNAGMEYGRLATLHPPLCVQAMLPDSLVSWAEQNLSLYLRSC